MNLPDVIAIATFAIAIMGVVYAFGLRDAKLSELDKDLNALGEKIEEEFKAVESGVKESNKRVSELGIFYVRVDQRVAHIEERVIGEEASARLRKLNTDTTRDYSSVDERYYSENSGIDL